MSRNKHIVKIEQIDFEGSKRLDFRLWVWSDDCNEYVPTKRGIAVRPDQLQAVKEQFDTVSAGMLPAA